MVEILLQKIAIWAIPVIFAITVHETAHGWIANKLGDKTALMLGRITLNPVKHIDLMGTIVIPLLCLSAGNFIFGWAKPVPVNYRNLNHPKRDMALVAIAGPLSNFMMALFWGAIMKLGVVLITSNILDNSLLVLMGKAGVLINLVLGVLNLIPIPPLDGSRVVSSFLPSQAAYFYNKIENIGFILLLILMFSGILGKILGPFIDYGLNIILSIYGLHGGF